MALADRLIDKLLGKLIRKGTLTVHYASGKTRHYGSETPGFPHVTMRWTDNRVARDILYNPKLGFPEAFIDGRIVLEEGDILDFITQARSGDRFEDKLQLIQSSLAGKVRNNISTSLRAINKPGSSKKNVAHHYDIGNALYELMLDPEHMQYSCAYWPDGIDNPDTTLGEAQEAKLAHIAAKLNLKPGLRVLDIGCGWGGMSIFLASRADVEVVGITLSEEQLALAQKRAEAAGVAHKIRFELIDYRDLAERGERFDRVVSVGMFEHVGVPQFETYFRAIAKMLTEDGCALIHTIGRMGTPGRTDAFTDKYIFPGGYIPALSETVAASEKVRLIATDIEVLRLHYMRTCLEWYRTCMAKKEEIEAMFDARFFRMWMFYLAGATTSFNHGGLCNFQIQYVRDREALPITRDYMAEAEAELLGR